MPKLLIILLIFTTTTLPIHSTQNLHHNRRILHQPFFPYTSLPPNVSPQPQPQPHPQSQPKYPFSSQSPPTIEDHFFPLYPSPPPPPSPPTTPTTFPTFPANISSLSLPQTNSLSKPISHKLIAIAISLSISSIFLLSITFFLIYHRRKLHQTFKKTPRSDSLRLFPPNTTTSDHINNTTKPTTNPPPQIPSTNHSSEFLYLGTLVSSREVPDNNNINTNNNSPTMGYQKLGSPELRPLPPLPRRQSYKNTVFDDEDDDDEFFSPRASSVGKISPEIELQTDSVQPQNSNSNSKTTSYPSSKSSSLSSSPSIALNMSPRSIRSKSPDSLINFPAPARPIPPPPARERNSNAQAYSPPGSFSGDTHNSPSRVSDVSSVKMPIFTSFESEKLPPMPPPLPPARYWENPVTSSNQVFSQNPPEHNFDGVDKDVEISKPKLKPLHWDKVRASSDRAMVWDQLKSSSFQLNEEMIETLFMVNSSNLAPKDSNTPRPLFPPINQENRVLDPKKSQNIAILFRALNVTIDEVCEALLEGNTDTLGTELLESLLKMAPTKEEERKLKEFTDETPFKLGPAEKFLKAVLDIPFAFKRVEAMLYIANFDPEIEYLKRSFETLEVACEELRNNRMFMKLLEAVLRTGNRMNVGTNRGDAHAFKLDTLLKLVDVKGTDGKTTLLHFVVQEIIRAEGSRLSGVDDNDRMAINNQQSAFRDDVEFRKLGLQVVSGLSGELSNVKKAAAMDSDVLTSEVTKLASGMAKIAEVVKLNEELALKESSRKFSNSMNTFLKNAEEEIVKVQAQESVALSMVKEITEYFHGNSAKEEAHPFRIFMVVRDFLSILDQVCKEVGKINERTVVSSARPFPLPVNSSLPPVFPVFNVRRQYSSSDDESS